KRPGEAGAARRRRRARLRAASRPPGSSYGDSSAWRPGSPGHGLRLFEDDEDVALGYRLTLPAADLGDLAGILGLDRHLHLHRFEDDDRVALVDLVAHLDLDLPDCAGDVRLYVSHAPGQ